MASKQEKLDQRLWAYIDGQLEPAQLAKLEKALSADPAMARRLGQLRKLRGLLADLPKSAVPAGMAERVLAQAERRGLLEGAGEEVRKGRSWTGRFAAAAALVLIAGMGLAVYSLVNRPTYLDKNAQRERAVAARHAPAQPASMPELALKEAPASARPWVEPASRPADASVAQAKPTEIASLKQTPQPAPAAAAEVAPAVAVELAEVPQEYVIRTDGLPAVRHDVELLLENSGIAYAPSQIVASRAAQPFATYAVVMKDRQATLHVTADESQLRSVVSQLDSVRKQQTVSQAPIARPAGAAPGNSGLALRKFVVAPAPEPTGGAARDKGMMSPEEAADLDQAPPAPVATQPSALAMRAGAVRSAPRLASQASSQAVKGMLMNVAMDRQTAPPMASGPAGQVNLSGTSQPTGQAANAPGLRQMVIVIEAQDANP